MSDSQPLLKVAGEPKELHETRLGAALPVLDMHAYVEDFGRSVVPAYRRGVADMELPADAGLARSIIPPGTAATRDFSRLAPRIPEFLLDKCVGCMACVAACPDTAILARVVPETEVRPLLATFAAGQPDPDVATETGRTHFASTTKYGDVPARNGHERGAFGIFVDPVHCKGCAECVEVCAALGHDALVMIDKVAEEPSGEGTVERYVRDMRFFRSLPPTPDVYRNEKALADLLLGENAIGYVGGAGSCAGCGEATAIRQMVAATRQIHGPEALRRDAEVRHGAGAARPGASGLRPLHRSGSLQGLRRVRRRVRRTGLRRAADGRQGGARGRRREHRGAVSPRHGVLPLTATDAGRVPQ